MGESSDEQSGGTSIKSGENTNVGGDVVGRDKTTNVEGTTIVISHNQSGGITAGTVNINAAPAPTLQAHEVFANRLEEGEYHSRIALTVDAPYPPANLYVAVHAPSIRRIELVPQRTGLVMMGHCGTREGMAFANLQSPFGRIHLEVFTGRPERLEVEWDIQ